MVHAVKIEPEYFCDYKFGEKLFEIRKNDRPYKVGDFLALNEYDGEAYTGRCSIAVIIYILDDPEYCKTGYVTLGIMPCNVSSHERIQPEIYKRTEEENSNERVDQR